MKNSLDIQPEKENHNAKLVDVNDLLLNKLAASEQKAHASSSIDSQNDNAELRWSIREKLFLVSFVLINGDSDWSYVSEQLNKWMESISTSSLKLNSNRRTLAVKF